MRISDWSSDVCSSDLQIERGNCHPHQRPRARRRRPPRGNRADAVGGRSHRGSARAGGAAAGRRGMTAHPLDRPIWSMLTGRQAHLAEGDDRALRIDRGYGVFGVAADTGAEAQAALAALVPEDGELWIVEGEPWPVPDGPREVKRSEERRGGKECVR